MGYRGPGRGGYHGVLLFGVVPGLGCDRSHRFPVGTLQGEGSNQINMTANERRPGFRLPWSSETDGDASDAPSDAQGKPVQIPAPDAPAADTPAAEAAGPEAPAVKSDATSVAESAEPSAATPDTEPAEATKPEEATKPAEATSPEPEAAGEFMRDLIAAMRKVADEARETGIAELRGRAEESVRQLEADVERRSEEVRTRAETDVAAVGEWAKAEAERIKSEAEQRVGARRAQLDQQLAAEASRAESEITALRSRVGEYERELDAFHAQLNEIKDPAAFAAVAKRMPQAPSLSGSPARKPDSPEADQPVADAGSGDANSNGATVPEHAVHPAEEEVLATRLAQLDASLGAAPAPADAGATDAASSPAPTATGESTVTEIIVKGLGSFGAITGFRQSLAGVAGIDGVNLSLGQTGEFVFRASHAADYDIAAAVSTLEGDSATVEPRPEGGLRVTLARAR